MSLLLTFARVTRTRPCPVCGRGDWCLLDRAEPPARAICARVESPRRVGEAGWLHRLRDERRPLPRRRSVALGPGAARAGDLAALADRYAAAVAPAALTTFAAGLGVTAASLRRLNVGWTGRAWSFPMIGGDGRVCGIRLRSGTGRKYSVTGGREGLFFPAGLAGEGPLLLPEGATDTAALLDLGFDAVGRPSCSGGVRLVTALVAATRRERVVVVADRDEPGQRGARALACALAPYCLDTRIITPPPPAKDAREWVGAGATRADVLAAIDRAVPWVIGTRCRRVGR